MTANPTTELWNTIGIILGVVMALLVLALIIIRAIIDRLKIKRR